MSDSASRQLRLTISSWHQRLEQTQVFGVLLSESVTLEDYCAALRVLYVFYREIEPAVAALTSELVYQPRLPLLQSDFRTLRLEYPSELNLETLALSASAAWGCRYVIEGSALGGTILTNHLTSRLGDKLTGAMHFYALRQPNLTWPQIQSKIDNVLSVPAMLLEACESACHCFERLYALARNEQS